MIHTPIDIDLDQLSKILGAVKGRESIESKFFNRLRDGLIGLGYSKDDAEDLVARELGWPSFDAISNSCNIKPENLSYILERRKNHRAQIQRVERSMEVDEIKALRRKEAHAARRGRYETMTAAEGQQYFFVDHPEYVRILENLMQDHTDVWMDAAITHYPAMPLEWDEFNKSFGAFWRKVLKFRHSQSGIFSEPGIEAIKRLAQYLYSWSFRRYLTGPIILRHASYLTREYRVNNIAIVRDEQRASLTVDEDYEYIPTDPEEEEGDDIGNRI